MRREGEDGRVVRAAGDDAWSGVFFSSLLSYLSSPQGLQQEQRQRKARGEKEGKPVSPPCVRPSPPACNPLPLTGHPPPSRNPKPGGFRSDAADREARQQKGEGEGGSGVSWARGNRRLASKESLSSRASLSLSLSCPLGMMGGGTVDAFSKGTFIRAWLFPLLEL